MQRIELLDYIFGISSFGKHIFKNNENAEPTMNKTQKKVLMTIAARGPLAMTKVSEKFGLEKGSFTQIADSLEELGYIKRVRSKDDRRMILLEITESGKICANKIHERTIERVNSLLGKLTKDQQEDLMSSLKNANKYIDIMLGKENCHEKAD